MININRRLLDELFVRKAVPYGNEVYLKYYQRIWPCEDTFRSFLHADSSESQIDIAKEIAKRMGFMANLPIPRRFFQVLIAAEHQGDDREESGYIAQDHAVHSINLYILGIYLFFSHEMFHRRLIRYFEGKRSSNKGFETPLESAVKAFLSSWRIFSLSHDLGYVWERGVDAKGNLNKKSGISIEMLLSCNDLQDEVLYDLVARSLARCLYADMLLRHSIYLSAPFIREGTGRIEQWRYWADDRPALLKEEHWNTLENTFRNHIQLSYINSYMGLKQLRPFVSREEILTVVRDQELRVSAFYFFQQGKAKVYFKKDLPFQPEELLELDHIGSDELPAQGYSCVYFIPSETSIDSKLKAASLRHFIDPFKEIANQAHRELSRFMVLNADDRNAEDNIYEIYQWICRILPLRILNLHANGEDEQNIAKKQIVQEDIRESFQELICESIKKVPYSSEPDFYINELRGELKHLLEEESIIKEVEQRTIHKSSQDPMRVVQTTLRTYFRQIIIEAKSVLPPFQNLIEMEKDHIQLKTGYAVEYADMDISCLKKLKENLQRQAEMLDINYEELIQYHSRYSTFDHGVMSARLLSETYLLYHSLYTRLSKSSILFCAWPVAPRQLEREVLQKDDQVFAETVFAILLHNVYTPASDPQGIEYCQDLSINTFSFFCAFCDNLQLWDRPKLIDPAYTSLPEERYSGNTFDLVVEDKKIRIFCRSRDILAFLSKKRDGLNQFMQDAPHLIDVTISE